MNPEELMFDDWVFLPKCYEPGEDTGYAQVTQLDCELWTDALEQIDYDEAKPIPLTAEIMKKNGFVCETWMPYWYIPHCHNLPYIEIFNNTEFVKDADEGFIIHIQYVHELQHLLKLFKIEKEIVL